MFVLVRAVTYAAFFIGLVLVLVPAQVLSRAGIAQPAAIDPGGISAAETDRLKTREDVFAYVRQLLNGLRDHAHRFILAASCNTAISADWQQLVWFRDAWREYGDL